MPKGRPKKVKIVEETKEEVEAIKPVVVAPVISEKEKLLNLRKQLADLKVNSVSDLDNLIAGAE